MESYFANMTAFSLFRPGGIEPKFTMMQHISEAEALVAAMFSFAARHCLDDSGHPSSCPTPSQFHQIALSRYDETVERYGDLRPPFWLLQAGVLITFYQLTQSVRSRAWRRLGECIRSSYEMNLHLVDANHDPKAKTEKAPADIQRWVLLEERRRAWWAVWEMDVFASTIRRLPTAINASVNLTMLPIADSCWFNDIYQESCFLTEDCSLRWKHLTESGNESAKAWFIVINSLMRNTQRIVYPAGSAMRILNDRFSDTHQDQLNIVANSLYCTTASLPSRLAYQGETLDFRPKPAPQNYLSPRQEHADKYAIHLLTQLCRFMIYHHKICAQAPWLQSGKKGTSTTNDIRAEQGQASATANSEWSNYMSASDEIVAVVRNSARDHYKYVNPFLANTLWFASAAQCACKVFGPPSFNKRLATSNLDLLKLTIDRYISFWGGMESLKGRLSRIETGLQSLMTSGQPEDGAGGAKPALINGGPHGPRGISGLDIPIDPGILNPNGAVSGPQPMLGIPSVGMNRWTDQRWPFQDFGDFTPQFSMTGQNFYPADPLDFSPFGMEELLAMNMDPTLGGTGNN